MKTKHFTRFFLLIFAISILIVIFSCKKKPKDPQPVIPPSTSFAMDFSHFSNASDTSQQKSTNATFKNWGHSFANVSLWNFIITVGLAVPVGSFVEALKQTATWDSREDIWTWSYNFTAANAQHTAKLTGKYDGEYIIWKMYITKQNVFTDFLWYEGRSHSQNTDGSWTLKDKPSNANDLLQIDWSKNAAGSNDIKYTNIVPSGAENGGYISYGISNQTLDAFYKIFNKGQNNLTEIEWSRSTKAGRVKDVKKFGDSNWHCWDAQLKDAVCP